MDQETVEKIGEKLFSRTGKFVRLAMSKTTTRPNFSMSPTISERGGSPKKLTFREIKELEKTRQPACFRFVSRDKRDKVMSDHVQKPCVGQYSPSFNSILKYT